MGKGYISFFNKSGGAHSAVFSPSRGGGETAGTVASSVFSAPAGRAFGGETAGTVAGSFGGGSFSGGGGCSFTAIA